MTSDDPLLAALADAAQRKQRAEHDIRLLLAYAREHTQPRPYRLADLADAAGKSISGIRTAYSKADIDQAARLTGGSAAGTCWRSSPLCSSTGRTHLPASVTRLPEQATRTSQAVVPGAGHRLAAHHQSDQPI